MLSNLITHSLSIIFHAIYGLFVLNLLIYLVTIVRIHVLYLIAIIKPEVWTICHCLGLGYETVAYAVCLSIYLWKAFVEWWVAVGLNVFCFLFLYTFLYIFPQYVSNNWIQRSNVCQCLANSACCQNRRWFVTGQLLSIYYLGTLLLTWYNFNLSMGK